MPLMRPLAVRAIFARVAVAALGVLVTVAVLEIIVRLTRIAPPLDAQYADFVAAGPLPFKPRPKSVVRGRAASREYDFEYAHNSLGFRDQEHSVAKPAGVFRIVALGDSFTYGIGADFNDTYLAQLERLLNARLTPPRRVEIIKLGVARYFPALEALVLQNYGLQFAPDAVMVAVLPNDVLDTHLGIDAIVPSPLGYLLSADASRLGREAAWLGLHSALARAVLARWTAAATAGTLRVDEIYRDGGFHEADWQRMESTLDGMQQLARQHGARFVLVSLPQRGPWGADQDYPDRRLARWCARTGVSCVATLPALRQAPDAASLYWPRDGHCTALGYGIIAQAIADELVRQHVLLPSRVDGSG